MTVTLQYEGLAALRERAKEEVGKVVVGQGAAVELLLVAAMARGHVLLEAVQDEQIESFPTET